MKQAAPWRAGERVLWPLWCAACGALVVDPADPLDKAEVEHPTEMAALDGAFRKFRKAMGRMVTSGRVLLVTDPLDQHAQMAFPKGVAVTELPWTQVEEPWATALNVPRTTVLPQAAQGPFDAVVWWHGLEHTRRPAVHLLALAKAAPGGGVWAGLPPWPLTKGGRLKHLRAHLPQHRFAAGPKQVQRLASLAHLVAAGPFAPGDLSTGASRRDPRWLYHFRLDPALFGREG